jgi:hypothetical protein
MLEISEKVEFSSFNVFALQWKDQKHQTPLKPVIGLFDPPTIVGLMPYSSLCSLLAQYL